MLKTLIYPLPTNDFQINLEAINNRFKHVCVFDSNLKINTSKYLQSSKIIAVGCVQELCVNNKKNALTQLQIFLNKKPGWVLGYLSYDLKNEIENLS